MNYEILTSRWRCPGCSAAVRLYFSQAGGIEEGEGEEFTCDRVLCEFGHELPEYLVREAIESSDDEFYAAMERGGKVAEIWKVPDPDPDSVPEIDR